MSIPPSRIAMEAIAGAVFEIGYHQVRHGHNAQLSRLAPLATYLVLAPFLGPAMANEFIDEKLNEAAADLAGLVTVSPSVHR